MQWFGSALIVCGSGCGSDLKDMIFYEKSSKNVGQLEKRELLYSTEGGIEREVNCVRLGEKKRFPPHSMGHLCTPGFIARKDAEESNRISIPIPLIRNKQNINWKYYIISNRREEDSAVWSTNSRRREARSSRFRLRSKSWSVPGGRAPSKRSPSNCFRSRQFLLLMS